MVETVSAFDLDIGAITDPGRKRRDEPNQDYIRVIPSDPASGRPSLLIIADGMGGYKGGALASQTVVETIEKKYKSAAKDDNIPSTLDDAIHRAHAAIKTRASQDPELFKMGSTVVMVVPTMDKVYCANVGDSRAYLLNSRQIKQISQDQSVVGEQVRAGLLTVLQALRHPKRNRLTQSLNAKRADIRPFQSQTEWSQDDVLLLCTDGLWGVISDPILRAVAWELPPQQAAEKLVELSKSSGAPDNVSVIIARRKGWQQSVPMDDDITDPGE